LGAGGGKREGPIPPVTQQTPVVEPTTEALGASPAGEMGVEQVVVEYTDSGFTPVSISVEKGTTVTFVNRSSGGMWVASDVHPTHQILPSFDQLRSVLNGGTYEYTFEEVGTWKYHNHVAPSDRGAVVVTE